ncbi:MAG: SRPBCC family protein [Phycisphaeraceae bacterium]
MWYQYWWPGALLAFGIALFWSVSFYLLGEMGWGLFVAVPFMLGALMGYRPLPTRCGSWLMMKGVAGAASILLIVLLMLGGFAGLFCGVLLLGIFLPAVLVGFYVGVFCARVLAQVLSHTAFRQREYLPVFVMLCLLPGIAHVIESAFAPPISPVDVQTSRVLPLDADRAWAAQLFYEEVPGPRPYLHRIGLPTPERVEGDLVAAGDRMIGHFSKSATITKEATRIEPGRLLAFRIAEQRGFEDGAIRFIHGRYDFEPVDAERTRVTLTSHYQPLLRPRVLWQPIEKRFARDLHHHILDGMTVRGSVRRFAQRPRSEEASR